MSDDMQMTTGSNMSISTTSSLFLNSTNTPTHHSDSNYVCLLAPLMFGAFFGNALVIIAFKKGPRKLRTLTNYFVINLAISDMLIGCVSLPLWIAINSGSYIHFFLISQYFGADSDVA